MIEKIKEIRVDIDALIQVTQKYLEDWQPNVVEANKSLVLGKMWLGKALGAMGDESPYKQDNDVSNNKIDDRADEAAIFGDLYDDIDMTDTVILAKRVRQEIENVITKLGLNFSFNNTSTDMGMYVNESRINLCEARMWLGEYLNYLKQRQDRSDKNDSEYAQIAYESYVASITESSAPGTKFDPWTDLPSTQREAWKSVVKLKGNNAMATKSSS
jgi:hypothetical protein